ncbi:MAG: hypothetical protein R3331_07285 [Sulfurospirillaceae bacterium]|nr:hypothetical protein [Sulfurospirillaceae bacterium]
MSKVFYKIYHGNLAFSAIEEEALCEVIDKTYFALLVLIETEGIKVGLELSGYTLEKIQELRPLWIKQFQKLHKKGLIELIGSGYMQMIAPLVPYDVNKQNQLLGLKVYKNILGITPSIVYVNEQTFSLSLVDLYHETGYKAIAMEWNNAYALHQEWPKHYANQPVLIKGLKKSMPVLWTDSILFQQFQRTVHNQQTIDDYEVFFQDYLHNEYKYAPIYSSDIEIFNYRPGRFETEAVIEHDEWKNISALCKFIQQHGSFELPSHVLETGLKSDIVLSLTDASKPILVKKQDKYSLSRWAACGHDANYINTLALNYYHTIDKSNLEEWKLCLKYWGSDYRTHTTQKKWKDAIAFLTSKIPNTDKEVEIGKDCLYINKIKDKLVFEKDEYKLVFLSNKGLALDSIAIKNKKLPFGTMKHGSLSNIGYVADFFTGSSVIESAATKKITDLVCVDNYRFVALEQGRFKLSTTINMKGIATEYKAWIIDTEKNSLTLQIELQLHELIQGSIRLGAFTLTSDNTQAPLWYKCKNGGEDYEQYKLTNKKIDQHLSKSLLQSSTSGLGITDGTIIFAEGEKTILSLDINQKYSYPFVMLQNHPDFDKNLTRLFFSLQEIDDTLKHNEQKLKRKLCLEYSINF